MAPKFLKNRTGFGKCISVKFHACSMRTGPIASRLTGTGSVTKVSASIAAARLLARAGANGIVQKESCMTWQSRCACAQPSAIHAHVHQSSRCVRARQAIRRLHPRQPSSSASTATSCPAAPTLVSATKTSSRSASRVVTSTMPQPSAWTRAIISPALVTSLL